jgi:hypothetical protein
METILGESVTVFVGLTLFLFGFAAFLTGQNQASSWKPVRNVILYSVLLGLGQRFLAFALFEEPLVAPVGFVVNTLVIMAIAVLAWRMRIARKMANQYPWLYERSGPFSWREKSAG